MSNQPEWKLLTSTDTYAIFIDETGEYPAEIEVAVEYFDGEPKWLMYRWPLDRLKWVEGEDDRDVKGERTLSPDEWFLDDLISVAQSSGRNLADLRDALTSEDPMTRAMAYLDISGHHGPDNFDQYPRPMSEEQFQAHTDKNW